MRALLLTLTMCLFVLPAQAKYSGGSGTVADPYQIATAADLIALGETPEDYDKHIILTADIDLDPNLPGRKVFDRAVIAPDKDTRTYDFEGSPFTGVFDGDGHKIAHVTIRGCSYLGLFGLLGARGEIKNLAVVDVNIIASGDYAGGLVGSNGWSAGTAGGRVTQCRSTGSMTGDGSDSCDGIGGLVGCHGFGGAITECHSAATVRGSGSVRHWGIGGLVGMDYGGSVVRCYSTGPVSGWAGVGGLVGSDTGGTVTGSYSAGPVSGNHFVGGLVGRTSSGSMITQCYSAGAVSGNDSDFVGGLVGYCDTGELAFGWAITNSVWNMEASGQSGSAGGVGLTTAEMMDPEMLGLNGFAGDPNWVLDTGRDYPRLAWEGSSGTIIPEPNVGWLPGQGTAAIPHRIDTADQLSLLRRASVLWDRHFVLGADIDLDPKLPGRRVFRQAVIQTFAGVLDGNAHTICHMTILGVTTAGLFGILEPGAEVKNLGVVDVNVTDSGIGGGLAGYSEGDVANCYTTGTVSGWGTLGGLVGWNEGEVNQCHSTVAVNGHAEVGGLAGINMGAITQCYSAGVVSGSESVGGLVGSDRLIVEGIGRQDVGIAVACFWDTQTSGQATSAGGTGKTTAEMQTAKTFLEAGWDFVGETTNGSEDIWWILEGKDYPRLWWEAGAIDNR